MNHEPRPYGPLRNTRKDGIMEGKKVGDHDALMQQNGKGFRRFCIEKAYKDHRK